MSKHLSFRQLELPASYQTLDFIADMHLDPGHPHTFAAWRHYMQDSPADAIFMLGDLFETWVGDDILKAPYPSGDFERQCMAVIAQAAHGRHIYFMHGNRDFALSSYAASLAHMQKLADPTLLCWQGQNAILTHGDLLCIDDVNYQKYRRVVHNRIFQRVALLLPLKTRMAAAQKIRKKSEATKKSNSPSIMDVNTDEVKRWLDTAQTSLMIHGHTHRPADHSLPDGKQRIVLTDWDLDNETNPRAQVLRWQAGHKLQRISLAG